MIRFDLFDAASFPTARFEAPDIVESEDAFEALGSLTLRDVTQAVALSFTLSVADHPDDPARCAPMRSARSRSSGSIGVGQGQWTDTSVVADEVVIRIHPRLAVEAVIPAAAAQMRYDPAEPGEKRSRTRTRGLG